MLRRNIVWKYKSILVTSFGGKDSRGRKKGGKAKEWKRALLSEMSGITGAQEAETTTSQTGRKDVKWGFGVHVVWHCLWGWWSKQKKLCLRRCNVQKKLGLIQHPLSSTLWSCNTCCFLRRYTSLKKHFVFPKVDSCRLFLDRSFQSLFTSPCRECPQCESLLWTTRAQPSACSVCHWKETWPHQERRPQLLSEKKHRHNHGAWKVLCFHQYFS